MTTKFPRFNSKEAWFDAQNRQWVFAGRLPEWEEMDIFVGAPCFVLDKMGSFPDDEDVVDLFRENLTKKVRVLTMLDSDKNGFKCLVLLSEV